MTCLIAYVVGVLAEDAGHVGLGQFTQAVAIVVAILWLILALIEASRP